MSLYFASSFSHLVLSTQSVAFIGISLWNLFMMLVAENSTMAICIKYMQIIEMLIEFP